MTTPLFRSPASPVGRRASRRNRFLIVAFAFCVVLWTVALLVPVPHKTATDILGSVSMMWIFGKTLHVCAYIFLTLFAGILPLTRLQRGLVLAGLVLHGGVAEFFQQFVNRGASFADWGLDCIGVTIGLLAGWRWWRCLFFAPQSDANGEPGP